MKMHLSRDIVAVRSAVADLRASATLLPSGEALLLLEGVGPRPPEAGQLEDAGEALAWQATFLDCAKGSVERDWTALAVVEALPRGEALLVDLDGQLAGVVTVVSRVGVSALDLFARAQALEADCTAIFHCLIGLLDRRHREGRRQTRAFYDFVQEFLEAAAIRDGFVELIAEPSTGGMFLQGWAQGIDTRPLRWISALDPLTAPDLAVAVFDRPDLLSPARGLCLFHKDLSPETLAGSGMVFVEQDSRLLRLDLVSAAAPRIGDAAASEHVAQMIPRLQGQPDVLSAFRRICRPRYQGEDTLSATKLPIAVGLDAVLQAPDGGLLLTGWMLDPDALVDLVLIKGQPGRYAPISQSWVRLPRPDLAPAFGTDPRFAGRMDPRDPMWGFIAYAPAGQDADPGEEVYLELVLGDHKCLFRPLRAAATASAERLPQILAAISPAEPELGRIIDDHIVPFLALISSAPAVLRHVKAPSSVPLGRNCEEALVAALMPFGSLDELQPIFSLLAGTPDAKALDLTLIAPRSTVEQVLKPLEQAFRFYGLAGRVMIAPDARPRPVWMDMALRAVAAPHVLAWSPRALPKGPFWVRHLLTETAGLDLPGLISPLLTYEDGSIRFGPSTPGQASVVGYSGAGLRRGQLAPVPVAAAEIALVDRTRLVAAGGFAGHLFSDALAHVDLSMRLSRMGGGIWCSGTVEFWSLDDAADVDQTPIARILHRVDSRLLSLRGAPDPEEHR